MLPISACRFEFILLPTYCQMVDNEYGNPYLQPGNGPSSQEGIRWHCKEIRRRPVCQRFQLLESVKEEPGCHMADYQLFKDLY